MTRRSTTTSIALLAAAALGGAGAVYLSPTNRNAYAATPGAALMAASVAQSPEPTIVWYGTDSAYYPDALSRRWVVTTLTRAWSNGRVESRWVRKLLEQYQKNDQFCNANTNCTTPWVVINDPAEGYAYRSDINADEQVNGADLAIMTSDWGAAPRQTVPPLDCPLNLVNP